MMAIFGTYAASDTQKQLLGAIAADEGQIQRPGSSCPSARSVRSFGRTLGVVASWSILLVLRFWNPLEDQRSTFAALTLGSFAIGSAIFLILELNEPYSGLFRVPRGAMQQAIEALR